MSPIALPSFAIIADAHLHDIDSDYDLPGVAIGDRLLTLRSWADTRRSSRVFNESKAALESTLNDIGRRGIKHVVLLGDYTDDGQIESTDRLVKILQHYRQKFKLNFYAIPGNHDVHGPVGKHQSTRFVTAPGASVLVTSSSEVAATESAASVLTDKMYCQGTPAGLRPMAEFGLFHQNHYLHWETPFGFNDSTDTRLYNSVSVDGQVSHKLVDASYLVEPEEGLWLLMLDANVFEPRNGKWKITQKKAFLNSSNAGWNSLLRNKTFLIDWITDVCMRAQAQNKNLFTFSHYPIINLDDKSQQNPSTLFGENEASKRAPLSEVAEILSTAGVQIHFGGHLHINGLTQRTINGRTITDVAVPSLVGFPPCYKVVHPAQQHCEIETHSLSEIPLDHEILDHYRQESILLGTEVEPALSALSYGDFLYKRMYSRVLHHYLPNEWPVAVRDEIVHTNTADLVNFMMCSSKGVEITKFGSIPQSRQAVIQSDLQAILDLQLSQHDLSFKELIECSMLTFITDWYCLKHAGNQAPRFIGTKKMKLYEFLTIILGRREPRPDNTLALFFYLFIKELELSIHRASSSRGYSNLETVDLAH
ncbi:MAG: metallophosphoesterase [Granulosicoccus sp.]